MHLKGTVIQRDRSSTCWFTSHMPAISKTRPDPNQEPGARSRSFMWRASSPCLPDTLAGRWSGGRCGTLPSGSGTHCSRMPAPPLGCFFFFYYSTYCFLKHYLFTYLLHVLQMFASSAEHKFQGLVFTNLSQALRIGALRALGIS